MLLKDLTRTFYVKMGLKNKVTADNFFIFFAVVINTQFIVNLYFERPSGTLHRVIYLKIQEYNEKSLKFPSFIYKIFIQSFLQNAVIFIFVCIDTDYRAHSEMAL